MSKEKVKALAAHILEECEQEGLTVAEAQMLPQELRFVLEKRVSGLHECTVLAPKPADSIRRALLEDFQKANCGTEEA